MNLIRGAAWNLAGALGFGVCQWLVVVVVLRIRDSAAVGEYALAMAVTAPPMMLAGLQLRAVLATDAPGRFDFSEYFFLRLSMVCAAAAGCILAAHVFDLPVATISAAAFSKAAESLGDLHYGREQRRCRLDRIATSQWIKGPASLAAIALMLLAGRPIAEALWASGAVLIAVLLCYDARGVTLTRPHVLQMKRLLLISAPLGVAMMLISLNQALPRYALEFWQGRSALGGFAAIGALAQTVALMVNAIGQAASSPLAQAYARSDRAGFRLVAGQCFRAGIVVVATASTISGVWGSELAGMLLGASHAGEGSLFFWQTLATGVAALGGLTGFALTARGEFRAQTGMFLLVTATTVSLSLELVPRFGPVGAAWAMLGAAVVQLGTGLWHLGPQRRAKVAMA